MVIICQVTGWETCWTNLRHKWANDTPYADSLVRLETNCKVSQSEKCKYVSKCIKLKIESLGQIENKFQNMCLTT